MNAVLQNSPGSLLYMLFHEACLLKDKRIFVSAHAFETWFCRRRTTSSTIEQYIIKVGPWEKRIGLREIQADVIRILGAL